MFWRWFFFCENPSVSSHTILSHRSGPSIWVSCLGRCWMRASLSCQTTGPDTIWRRVCVWRNWIIRRLLEMACGRARLSDTFCVHTAHTHTPKPTEICAHACAVCVCRKKIHLERNTSTNTISTLWLWHVSVVCASVESVRRHRINV